MRTRWLTSLALVLVGPAVARADVVAATTVESARPDAVTLTIYRDFLALVTETREVDLPAGPVKLVFKNVAETLIPPSVVVRGVADRMAEINHRFDPLTSGTLFGKSVGEEVVLTRTNPATGKVSRMAAMIESAERGVVLRTREGNEILRCSGLPEAVEFTQIPAGLAAEPELAVYLREGQPGKVRLAVSYLAYGFAWESNYVANIHPTGKAMDLDGWVTLKNYTGRTFTNANVQVVAGQLNLLDEDEGGSRAPSEQNNDDFGPEGGEQRDAEREDWMQQLASGSAPWGGASPAALFDCQPVRALPPIPNAPPPVKDDRFSMLARESALSVSEVVVTAARRVEVEQLADYHLYRVPWATDLGARSTKQALFLDKSNVPVDRYYAFALADLGDDPGDSEGDLVPELKFEFQNTQAASLGEPLPRGTVRVFESAGGGRALFAGEAQIADKAVGLPVELTLGSALDLALRSTVDPDTARYPSAHTESFEHSVLVRNSKSVAAEFQLRQYFNKEAWRDVRIRGASSRPGFRNGYYFWRVAVPANGVAEIAYVAVGRSAVD